MTLYLLKGCKVLQWACLYVSVSQKRHSKLHKISYTCYLWLWLGPLLRTMKYIMSFQFSGWRYDACLQWATWHVARGQNWGLSHGLYDWIISSDQFQLFLVSPLLFFCFCYFGSVQRIKMAIHQFLDAHLKLTELWFLHPAWHKIGHFGDIPQANLLPLGACKS